MVPKGTIVRGWPFERVPMGMGVLRAIWGLLVGVVGVVGYRGTGMGSESRNKLWKSRHPEELKSRVFSVVVFHPFVGGGDEEISGDGDDNIRE